MTVSKTPPATNSAFIGSVAFNRFNTFLISDEDQTPRKGEEPKNNASSGPSTGERVVEQLGRILGQHPVDNSRGIEKVREMWTYSQVSAKFFSPNIFNKGFAWENNPRAGQRHPGGILGKEGARDFGERLGTGVRGAIEKVNGWLGGSGARPSGKEGAAGGKVGTSDSGLPRISNEAALAGTAAVGIGAAAAYTYSKWAPTALRTLRYAPASAKFAGAAIALGALAYTTYNQTQNKPSA